MSNFSLLTSSGGFEEEFSYCPELKTLLRDRRTVGCNGKIFTDLGCLSSFDNLTTLRKLCLKLAPATTLEIGLGFGGSALVFASSHRDLGRGR